MDHGKDLTDNNENPILIFNKHFVRKKMSKQNKLKQGKELAKEFFDYKIIDLEKISDSQKQNWMKKYSSLSSAEFEDVRHQVINAKSSQQAQVGWQIIPHDLTVLVFCVISALVSLKTGLIASIAVLIMLESIFQVYYNYSLYKILGYSVWLTYPAYLILAYVLFQRGMPWWQILIIIALAWGATFLLGMLAAIPMRLYLKARAQSKPMPQKKKAR